LLPYDSFLIDAPWLVSFGWIFGKLVNRWIEDEKQNKRARKFLSAVTLLCFYVTSISLYFNLEWVRWLWRMCGAESGRDWMINSGVFNFDWENMTTKDHVICAALFALYPVWLKIGYKLADIGKSREEA